VRLDILKPAVSISHLLRRMVQFEKNIQLLLSYKYMSILFVI
jgi:hypothetical protein